MSLNTVIEEYDKKQRLYNGYTQGKSQSVIVSQSSMEREVINNVGRMTISDRNQKSNDLSTVISNSQTVLSSSPITTSNSNVNQMNRQQTSVITYSSVKSSGDKCRMKLMQRQNKIDEDDLDIKTPSKSFDETKKYPPRSLNKHISFDNSIHDRNYSRHQDKHQNNLLIDFKSKSLDYYDHLVYDVPGASSQQPFFYSSDSLSSRSSEEDTQNITRNFNRLPTIPPYYRDIYNSNQPVRSSDPQVRSFDQQLRPSDHQIRLNGHQKTSNGVHLNNGHSNIDNHELHSKTVKYGQRRAFSQNTHPYDRINAIKSLRRIYSEEIVPVNDEKPNSIETIRKMRRSSSYNTLKDINSSPKTSKIKPTTKMIFPESNNVAAYRNVFMKQNKPLDLPPNNLDLVNYLNKSLIYKSLDDDQDDNKKRTDAQKSKAAKQVDTSLIPPYQYEPQIDDDIAVHVTGLLTLPGSNEKRYPISVGELRRRISPPEYLNKVDMISYVRLAKTTARELLEKHAIRPKHHCRRSKHSVMSKMCEAECSELAKGLKSLSEEYFPKEWFAKRSMEQLFTDENVINNRESIILQQSSKLKTAREVLQGLQQLLTTSKTAEAMQSYNLATHAYGIQDLQNNIYLIDNIIEKQIKLLSSQLDTEVSLIPKNSTNNTNQTNMEVHGIKIVNNNAEIKLEDKANDMEIDVGK